MVLREEHYRRLNGKFLKDAEELLRNKDYVQASEKFWGAVAEIIKAVAAKRGISLGTHRSLGNFIIKLDKEYPRLSLINDFSIANNLHINFYEDWMPPEIVEKNAEVARSFVRKMERLL